MRNQSKIIFLILVLSILAKCDRYDDNSEEIVDDKITTSKIEDNDTAVQNKTTTDNENKTNLRKVLFDDEDENITSTKNELSDEENAINEKQMTETKSTFVPEKLFEVTTRSWLREPTEFNKTASKHGNDGKEWCPKFNYGGDFDYNDMVDVWQVAYYQSKEKVHCFKIHIRKVPLNEKIALRKKFGTFNGKVHWSECSLEIRSSAHMQRTHYLEGNNEDDGVMNNIIILGASPDDKGDTDITPTLHDEIPNQWLVYRNLLLMRDCETGNIVVFSRVPHQPSLEDILDALKEFGNEDTSGKLACIDEEIIKPFDTEEDGSSNFE